MALTNGRSPLFHFASELYHEESTRWIAAILFLDCAILNQDIEATALLVIWLNETEDPIIGYTSEQRMKILCLLEILGSFCNTPHQECLWRHGIRQCFDQDSEVGIKSIQLAAKMGHQGAIDFLKNAESELQ